MPEINYSAPAVGALMTTGRDAHFIRMNFQSSVDFRGRKQRAKRKRRRVPQKRVSFVKEGFIVAVRFARFIRESHRRRLQLRVQDFQKKKKPVNPRNDQFSKSSPVPALCGSDDL